MNTTIAKLTIAVATAAACLQTSGGTYLNKLRQSGGWFFYLPDGTPVAQSAVTADKGCDVTTVDMVTDNISFASRYDFNSWTIANTNRHSSMTGPWMDSTGSVTLRGGGLSIAANDMVRFASKTDCVRIILAASQTWRGPASGTTYGVVGLGMGNNYGNYGNAQIGALDDLTWTLDGRIAVAVSASNDLSRVDIVVNPEARLIVMAKASYYPHHYRPRLNAKSLTLKGGDTAATVPMLTVGANNQSMDFHGSVAPTSFDDMTFSPVVRLVDGASVTGGTVEYGVSDLFVSGGDSTFSGSVTIKKPVAINIGSGATLTFTGDVKADAGAGIEVTGGGSLVFTQKIIDIPLSGNGAIRCDASAGQAYLSPRTLENYAGSVIEVTGGTLFLDSVAALPQGCKVVTSGAGSLALVDAEGFDADVHMGGTKNYVADYPLVVTDAARENESLSVLNGQTLFIAGSGLKSSSSVSLEASSSIIFTKTATVSAPVSVAGETTIATATSEVKGTFAGSVTFASGVSGAVCEMTGGGDLIFAGGMTIPYGWGVRQRKGLVTLKDRTVSMQGGYGIFEGRCLITNCTVSSGGSNVYPTWRLDRSDQTGDAVLEVAAGGKLILGNNATPYFGGSTRYESKLLINGGTMEHSTYDTVRINDNGDGNGIIEFAAGKIVSQRRIIVGFNPGVSTGSARFVWRGGTWETGGSYPYRYHHLFEGKSAACGLEFSIEGPDCVLDLGKFLYPDSITNFSTAASTMVGKPGAKLTVKGKGGTASKLTLANFTPNGMAFDLNATPNADVEVIGDGTDLEIGWVLPGTGGVVSCAGTASPLLADYVVPAGATFENADINDDWHTGFSAVATNNLAFGEGATYLLRPTATGIAPLDFAGTLTAAGTVAYAADESAAKLPPEKGVVLIRAAGGVAADEWTATTGKLANRARVYASGTELRLDAAPKGTVLTIR